MQNFYNSILYTISLQKIFLALEIYQNICGEEVLEEEFLDPLIFSVNNILCSLFSLESN